METRARIVHALAIASVAWTAGACQTMDENRRATGAVLGGAAGTTAGALIDRENRWRGALIGAAAGAALGTGVGHVLQKQKEAFDRIEGLETRQQTVILQQQPASYHTGERVPSREATQASALNVRLSSDILFDRGSSALSARGTSKIAELSQVIRQDPDSDVYIRGCTSSEGTTGRTSSSPSVGPRW